MLVEVFCPHCGEVSEYEVVEYQKTPVDCPYCKGEFDICYSEDCDENYDNCWDSYFPCDKEET